MCELIIKIIDKYGISSIETILMLISMILSPVLTYLIFYQRCSLLKYDGTVVVTILMILTGCLFTLIYYFSSPFAGCVLSNKMSKLDNNDNSESNQDNNCNSSFDEEDYLNKASIVITALFMSFLSIVLILNYYLKPINRLPDELKLLSLVIFIYILSSWIVFKVLDLVANAD